MHGFQGATRLSPTQALTAIVVGMKVLVIEPLAIPESTGRTGLPPALSSPWLPNRGKSNPPFARSVRLAGVCCRTGVC